MNTADRFNSTRKHGAPDVHLHIDRLVIDRAITGSAGTGEIQAELQDRLRELLQRHAFAVQHPQDSAVPYVAPPRVELAGNLNLRSLTEKTARSIFHAVSETVARRPIRNGTSL